MSTSNQKGVDVPKLLNDLENANKSRRREALNTILKIIHENANESMYIDLSTFLPALEDHFIARLSDDSELNRLKSSTILKIILERQYKSQKIISYIIPIFYHRIGKIPIVEECEENRLIFMQVLEKIIDSSNLDMGVHTNDLCSIFITSLGDSYPEVVLTTCDCICKFSFITGEKFQTFSNLFVKPLVKCLSRHRLKVRVKSINTLECINTHGSCEEFADNIQKLKKSMFDISQVRQALLSFGFTLSTKMKERYSFWSLILPFILFGLRDEDAEIQETAQSMWEKIGLQYLSENEDIKSKMENHCENYGSLTTEFNFNVGCQALIQRAFHRMLPQISSDLQDWQVDVRLNGAKLLSICIVGLGTDNIQYAAQLLNILCRSVNDQDSRVSNECVLCSGYLGYFIPPSLYIPLMKPSLAYENEGSLRIFSALVQNTPAHNLHQSVDLLVDILRFSSLKHLNLSSGGQKEIILVMHRLFNTCTFEEFDADLLFTLFYVISSDNDDELTMNEQKPRLFEVLAKSFRRDSAEMIIADHMKTCILKLTESPSWTIGTEKEIHIFYFLSKVDGFSEYLEEVSTLLKKKLEGENSPLVSFTILHNLVDVVRRCSLLDEHHLVNNWSVYIVQEHILKMIPPNTTRTGEGLRMAAVSSLISITKYAGHGNRNVFEELVRRLDDIDRKVRRVAASSLICSLKGCSKWRENADETKTLITSVSVYILDDDSHFQSNIIDVLKILGESHPDHLVTSVESTGCHEDILHLFKLEGGHGKENCV